MLLWIIYPTQYKQNLLTIITRCVLRLAISVNEADAEVFVWDTEMNMFRSLSEDTAILPDGLMRKINETLLEMMA